VYTQDATQTFPDLPHGDSTDHSSEFCYWIVTVYTDKSVLHTQKKKLITTPKEDYSGTLKNEKHILTS
jgi:hypothetical protein